MEAVEERLMEAKHKVVSLPQGKVEVVMAAGKPLLLMTQITKCVFTILVIVFMLVKILEALGRIEGRQIHLQEL